MGDTLIDGETFCPLHRLSVSLRHVMHFNIAKAHHSMSIAALMDRQTDELTNYNDPCIADSIDFPYAECSLLRSMMTLIDIIPLQFSIPSDDHPHCRSFAPLHSVICIRKLDFIYSRPSELVNNFICKSLQ